MSDHEARATQLENLALEQHWVKGLTELASLTMQQAQVHATLAVADEIRNANRRGERNAARGMRRV